jgi:hypothetical protein
MLDYRSWRSPWRLPDNAFPEMLNRASPELPPVMPLQGDDLLAMSAHRRPASEGGDHCHCCGKIVTGLVCTKPGARFVWCSKCW